MLHRSTRLVLAATATILVLLLVVAPALAQSDADNSAAGAVGGLLGLGITSIWCCLAIVGSVIWIAGLVLWIIMLIDCIQRQPNQFPNAGENTKTIWLIVLIASWFVFGLYWLAAIVYYFMVKRAVPRSA